MINKIRHGSEITSAKLNEIIDAVNKYEAAGHSVVELASDYKEQLKTFNALRDGYFGELGDTIKNIPGLRELVAAFSSIEGFGIEWVDKTKSEEENLALLSEALIDGNSFPEPKQRVRFTQAHTVNIVPLGAEDVIEWRTPHILFDVDTGTIFVDVTRKGIKQRIPFSAGNTEDLITAIIENTPSISIVKSDILDADGNERFFWRVGDTVYNGVDGPLVPVYKQGPAGRDGQPGPQGKDGERGMQGMQGQPGKQGADGASTVIETFYSNYASGKDMSLTYNDHKYVGFKSYLSTATASEIEATPIKWMRLRGPSFIPYVDGKKIKWKEVNYTSDLTSDFEIDLSKITVKGDTGPKGDAPLIRFTKADDNGDMTTIRPIGVASEGTDVVYTYDVSNFVGPQGPIGETGATGKEGPMGPMRPIEFDVKYSKGITEASVKSDLRLDGTYAVTLNIPQERSIDRIERVSNDTNRTFTTYRIHFTDNSTPFDFDVRNGRSITGGYVDKRVGKIFLYDNEGNRIELLDLEDVKGDPGESMSLLGTRSQTEIEAIKDGKPGNAYYCSDTQTMWFWDSEKSAYQDSEVDFKGPPGKRGAKWHVALQTPVEVEIGGETRYLVTPWTIGETDTLQEGDWFLSASNFKVYEYTGEKYGEQHGSVVNYNGKYIFRAVMVTNDDNTKTHFGYDFRIDQFNVTMLDPTATPVASVTHASNGTHTMTLEIPRGLQGETGATGNRGRTIWFGELVGFKPTDEAGNDYCRIEIYTPELPVTPGIYPNPELGDTVIITSIKNSVASDKYIGKAAPIYDFPEFKIWDEEKEQYRYSAKVNIADLMKTPFKGEKGDTGEPGEDGEDGVGILSIENDTITDDNGENPREHIVINYTDGTKKPLDIPHGIDGTNGKDGERGPGIFFHQNYTAAAADKTFLAGDKIILSNGDLYDVVAIKADKTPTLSHLTNFKGDKGDSVYVFMNATDLTVGLGETQNTNEVSRANVGQNAKTVTVGCLAFNPNNKRMYLCTQDKSTSDHNEWLCYLVSNTSDFITYENGVLTIKNNS